MVKFIPNILTFTRFALTFVFLGMILYSPSAKVEELNISDGLQNEWKGFSYQCPECSAVLGVQINPVALNEYLKENILSELQRTPPTVG